MEYRKRKRESQKQEDADIRCLSLNNVLLMRCNFGLHGDINVIVNSAVHLMSCMSESSPRMIIIIFLVVYRVYMHACGVLYFVIMSFIIFSNPSTQLKCTCELGYPKREQQHLINPRRMCCRVTVVVLSLCVCVTMKYSTYRKLWLLSTPRY